MSNSIEQLPDYWLFCDKIGVLALPISGSKLHGVMCGYLCAGALHDGDAYLRALTINKRGTAARTAAQAVFQLYTISQHQIDEDNFSFQLFLPDDEQPLSDRALAFSEWCEGFIQALSIVGVTSSQLDEEESQEALMHFAEFSKLDYDSLKVGEEDEKAFMEVTEYARMAVLGLYWDIRVGASEGGGAGRVKH